MIAIVSANAGERTALVALCESERWASTTCDSLRSFARSIQRVSPNVVVTRHKLEDGYSDDVIAALSALQVPLVAKIVVLAGAGMASAVEGRQVAIGADCVLRDPVRMEVLVAYLRKYLTASVAVAADTGRRSDQNLAFAGGTLNTLERTLQHRGRTVLLTPREVALVELLARSAGDVVTYDALYSEILDRQFRGDTSNMRVLLGKLSASVGSIGISFRDWVDVIPKTGYRYTASRKK